MPLDERRRQCPALILASTSPRRRELMVGHGFDVQIVAPPYEEPDRPPDGITPNDLAEKLSYYKAESVAGRLQDGIVIAGDTVVALDGAIYGKPDDKQHAGQILREISGTTHEVITGVTLYSAGTKQHTTRHDRTAVTMKKLSDSELQFYLESNEWKGKAGAYGIQTCGDKFVTKLEGSFSNVVGFPMELVTAMLAEWMVFPDLSSRRRSL